jgi:hypothetical protein
VALRSALDPHPATTQMMNSIAPQRLTVRGRHNALTPPFMRRRTRNRADPFQRATVTNLTNHPADTAVRWMKLVTGGFRR